MELESKKVLVTGVTGYVGAWVGYKLIEEGKYQVTGTVRNKDDQNTIDVLREGYKDKFDSLNLVNMDLNDSESIINAIEGFDYVVHVASPFPSDSPEDASELIDPAVNGTKAVLEGCLKHKIQRLVVTSSVVAIYEFEKGDVTLDETTFATVKDTHDTYTKSKILAEAEIWKFVEENKDNEEKTEVTVLNPGFVLGPLKINKSSTSAGLAIALMSGGGVELPPVIAPAINVCNLADAHVKALVNKPGRYCMGYDSYALSELAQFLEEEFKPKGYDVKFSTLPKSAFENRTDIDGKYVYSRADVKVVLDSKKIKEEFGMEFTDIKTTLKEMGESLIEFGVVKT